MGAPDIVVPVREGAVNEQLRFALRSWAAHLPHGRVWLVGHRPRWAANVEHIATRQTGTKYQNSCPPGLALPGVNEPTLVHHGEHLHPDLAQVPERFPALAILHLVDASSCRRRSPVPPGRDGPGGRPPAAESRSAVVRLFLILARPFGRMLRRALWSTPR
ncbi:hypothetical protein ABZ129_15340, partial [Streptomyces sp. NPDC006307]